MIRRTMTGSSSLSPLHAPSRGFRKSSSNNISEGWDDPPVVGLHSSSCSISPHSKQHGWVPPHSLKWRNSQRVATLYPNSIKGEVENDSKDSGGTTKQNEEASTTAPFEFGSLFCAPVIVGRNKYLAVALGTTLYLYSCCNNDSCDEKHLPLVVPTPCILPLAKLELSTEESESLGEIVQINFHDESNIFYLLTVDSNIFQVRLILWDFSGKVMKSSLESKESMSPRTDSSPKLNLLSKFHTRELGATCMVSCRGISGNDADTLCVGYRSGIIQTWLLTVPKDDRPLSHELLPSIHSPSGYRRKSKLSASLQWQGYMYHSIRTLAFIPCKNKTGGSLNQSKEETSQQSTIHESPDSEQQEKSAAGGCSINYSYLVVCMDATVMNVEEQHATSSMMEVLDMERIFNDHGSECRQVKEENSKEELCLEEYTIPHTPGTELIDSNTLPTSDRKLPRQSPVIRSHGADASTILINANKAGNPRLSVSLPDGTVALLSCSEDPRMKDTVGIFEDVHQLLLPYPAIGCGHLVIPSSEDDASSYVAYCMRGGTSYLIPTRSAPYSFNVDAVPFWNESSSDLDVVYIQAFAAGNLWLDKRLIPVLIFGWSSGAVDVYSCGLLPVATAPSMPSNISNFVSRAQKKALQEMIDNKSVQTVAQILRETRDGVYPPSLQCDWWNTLLNGSTFEGNSITLEMLCSKDYESLRRVLLSISMQDSQNS